MATTTAGVGKIPYMGQLAQFARAYGATDADSFYNSSIFDPMMMCGGINPGLMGMMQMYGTMNPMAMGFMNPMYMMKKTFNPGAYDAMLKGINPSGSFYFGNSEKFSSYNGQQTILSNGLAQLAEYAKGDNQDDFQAIYNKILVTERNRIRSLQPNISEPEMTKLAKANINQTFMQMTGTSLGDLLNIKGDHPLWQGFKDALSFKMFSDKRTVQENIAMVNDAPQNSVQRDREKRIQNIGSGLGYIGMGAGIGAALGAGVPGAIVGAIAGLGWGIIQSFMK